MGNRDNTPTIFKTCLDQIKGLVMDSNKKVVLSSDKQRKRNFKRKLLNFMPKFLRYKVMRNMVHIKPNVPHDFSFKIAQTKEEFEQAYSILHDNYVECGYMQPHSSGMRITKYFLLPSTTTIIILLNQKVIGTMSIIRKTRLGLPMEKSFDLSPYEKSDEIIAEVSALAIDKNFSRGRAELFLPICKFFYEFIRNYMGIHKVFIAVNPAMADFYEGFLLFERVKSKVIDTYSFANGAPAVGLYGDLEKVFIRMKSVYDSKPLSKNLFHFFTQHKLTHFSFPERYFHKSMDPHMTPEMIQYFFIEKSDVLSSLTKEELNYIMQLYPRSLIQEVEGLYNFAHTNYSERKSRFLASMDCQIENKNFKILDLSLNGIKISGHSTLNESSNIAIIVEIAPHRKILLNGHIRWVNAATNQYGIALQKPYSKSWIEYVAYLEDDFNKLLYDVREILPQKLSSL